MSGTQIDFTVVVPTRRRPRELARCLEAIGAQDYAPERYEAIVVDDGRDPETAAVVARFRGRFAVELIAQARRGPAAARNTGAERATGARIAFTDDDCAPDSAWLSELGRELDANPRSLVGGLVVNAVRDNVFSETSQVVIDAVYAHYGSRRRGMFFTSNNLALPLDAFREVGGFDASFPYAGGEDRDFGDRASASGLELRFAAGAIVRHHHRLSLASFVRQHFRYGRGASQYNRARRKRGLRRVGVTPSFYVTLMRIAVRRRGRIAQLAALTLLSQLAYAGGFGVEALIGTAGPNRR